ncbi:MAG TPA: DUF4266 domain-containing protein [bacterium]|nr:DUF4266 domain-containing protein [bacterium]
MIRAVVSFGLAVLGALVLLLGGTTGCATVRPYEKEYLADPIMTFRQDTEEAAHDLHWIEAREGSTGGTGVSGGGCACN